MDDMNTITIPSDFTDGWMWTAIYSDNMTLNEINKDKTSNYFHHINQDKLIAFVLRPLHPHLPQFAVQLHNEKRLIFFRRRTLLSRPSASGEIESQRGQTWHVLGYQVTVNGTNVKTLSFISEDGNSVLTDDPDAV